MKLRKRTVQKSRITFRKVAVATTLMAICIASCFFLYLNTAVTLDAYANIAGDFRTKSSGTWTDKNIWQTYNGSSWVNATTAPAGGGFTATVKAGHTVTNSTGQSLDNVIIEPAGILNHTNGTFMINNGNNKDMIVSGRFIISGSFVLGTNSELTINGYVEKASGSFTISNNSKVVINSAGEFKKIGGGMDTSPGQWEVKLGGTYNHGDNGNNLPRADWQSGSYCIVTGSVNNIPGNLDQDFSNFTWNCPSQNQQKNLGSALQSILGDFRMVSTGSGSLLMNQGSNQTMNIAGNYIHDGGIMGITESGNWVVSIGGNFIINGGSVKLTDGLSSNSSGNPVIRVAGNMEINAGTVDMSQFSGTASNSGIGTIDLKRNLTINGGTLTENSTTTGAGQINFTGTTEQNFVKTGGVISQTVNFKVIGNSILNLGSYTLDGGGRFDQEANAKIIIGSADGITAASVAGNVQVSGTRNFSTSGYYEYRSSSSQIAGNGLPSQVKKMIVNTASSVTLSNSLIASDSLILTSGLVITGNNTLSLGTSVTNNGRLQRINGSVDGNFRRWIPASPAGPYLFPLSKGGRYLGANVTFSANPSTPGTITSSFTTGHPGILGLPLTETSVAILNVGSFGVWNLIQGNGLVGGGFTLNLEGNGFTAINDIASLRILTRTNSAALWTLNGSHQAGQGSGSSPIARRAGLNIYGQYTFGGSSANPLPIALTNFSAKNSGSSIEVAWTTATELNNDYFDVERSANGKDYTSIGRVRGAGSSNRQLDYSYTDKNPLDGTSYYRLRQTDYDGSTKAFEPKSVKRENEKTTLTLKEIYPNPFTSEINCRFQSELTGEAIFTIVDLNGRTMNRTITEAFSGSNEVKINSLDGLSPGYYLLSIQIGESRQSMKILKRN